MAEKQQAESDVIEVDLRNPWLAGILTWLIPGAGHFYQRRYAKGALFTVCVLGTYFFGLYLAEGHVVYSSWSSKGDKQSNPVRWHLIGQAGVGTPTIIALAQAKRCENGKEPLFGGFLAPPMVSRTAKGYEMEGRGTLAQWHYKYHSYFELGTVYTMIAGLLNILVIYDACAGPVIVTPEENDKPPEDESEADEQDGS